MPNISPEDYQLLQYIKQQNQVPGGMMPPGPNDWTNNIQPDGSLAGAQVSAGPRPTQQQKPSATNQIGGAIGGVGGLAAGQYAANQIGSAFGSSAAPAAPSIVSTSNLGASTAAPTGLVGSQIAGSGASAGGATVFSSAEAAQAAGYTPVGTAANGGVLATYGTEAPGLGSYAAAAAPYVGGALGAYGLYDVLGHDKTSGRTGSGGTALQGAASGAALGASVGSIVPGIGTVIGGAVGGVAGGLAGLAHNMFGSRKGTEQLNRDAVRKALKEHGFIDDKYNIDLPNGQKFNIGKDGSEPWYNVDFTDPNIGGLVAAVQPLAAFITGGDKKLTSDFAGYLTNAAHSGGDPMENVMSLYEKTGMNHDQIYGAIHLMSKSQGGNLDDSLADAYKNGLDQLYGVGAYEGKSPQFGKPPANMAIPSGQLHGQEQMPGYRPPQGVPQKPPSGATPPPSGVQHPTAQAAKGSPFIGSANYQGGGGISGRTRISPGVWADQKGQYNSKTGTRGQ